MALLKKIRVVIVFLFTFIGITVGQEVIKASDFGVRSTSFSNASPAIRKAIEACDSKSNVVLELPGGRIDLWPEGAFKKELYISNSTENDNSSKIKNIAFLLEGKTNFTIDGNNTLVMLHGKMESFAFLNCTDIVLKNIRFDYERPTMSEMTITSLTPTEARLDIHPDSRFIIENGKIVFYGEGWKSNSLHTISFSPSTEFLDYSSLTPFINGNAIQTGCREVTFKGDFSKVKEKVGDVLTVRDPYRDNSGGFISQSKDIRLENVKMHYMHGLGIVSQFSENITLFKVIVAPSEKSGRIISSFADCFHFSGCKGTITIDSCATSGSHDDPINVHGTHLQITAVNENRKLTVKFMHHQTYGFPAFFVGDSIAFVHPETLMAVASAKLKSARLVNNREMELEVEGAMPDSAKVGYCIENLTWTPSVIIRNSRFERTNTRGILITTRRKVLIENNTFYRIGMHAILIADDASNWFESGPVCDVTIRNNNFIECASGEAVIAIAPENHTLLKNNIVHKNIRIENNLFKVFEYPILSARSTANLIFSGNKIIRSEFKVFGTKKPSIELTACKDVLINRNSFDTPDSPVINTNEMLKKDIRVDKKLTILFNSTK